MYQKDWIQNKANINNRNIAEEKENTQINITLTGRDANIHFTLYKILLMSRVHNTIIHVTSKFIYEQDSQLEPLYLIYTYTSL